LIKRKKLRQKQLPEVANQLKVVLHQQRSLRNPKGAESMNTIVTVEFQKERKRVVLAVIVGEKKLTI